VTCFKWRYYSPLSDVIRINFFPPPNCVHRFVIATQKRHFCRSDWLQKCYLQKFIASRRSWDRPKLSSFSVVLPSLQHMLSRYRTPLCDPPTANIDSSPQCGLQIVVANTPAWQQLSACILRFTPDTPTSIRFTFRIYHRFTFCKTCLYQKDERVLNGELKAWTARSVQCLATGWAKEESEFSSH